MPTLPNLKTNSTLAAEADRLQENSATLRDTFEEQNSKNAILNHSNSTLENSYSDLKAQLEFMIQKVAQLEQPISELSATKSVLQLPFCLIMLLNFFL